MTRRNKHGKPREIRVGSFVARLYHAEKVVSGRPWRYFRLAYHKPGGGRVVRDFKDEPAAIRAAKEIASSYAFGRPSALNYTSAELQEYEAARHALEGTGVGLFAAVQGFLVSRESSPTAYRTVTEVVSELIAERMENGRSEVHLRDLQSRLGAFARAFQCGVASVNANLIREYLRSLRTDEGHLVAPRTRLNFLRNIGALFRFAGKRRYVPPSLVADVVGIESPKTPTSEPGIFTPAQMQRILAAASDELVPILAVGGFAGLRTAELARLDWRDIRLKDRLIVLASAKTKTAQRRIVPILDNLAAWLAPHEQPEGMVNPATNERTLASRFSRVGAKAGVPWVPNALRHSFCSYRLAATHDPARVAVEAGNSAAMLHAAYKALVSEADAAAWFSIRPNLSTVVDIPQEAPPPS